MFILEKTKSQANENNSYTIWSAMEWYFFKGKIFTGPNYWQTDIQIEHIGSTSISGMPAKPIIDILVGVPKMEYFSEIVSKLSQKEEYIYFKIYEKNINFRRFFLKLKLNKPIVYPNVIDSGYTN